MPVRIGETFAGFTIVRLMGSGGMGEAYLASIRDCRGATR